MKGESMKLYEINGGFIDGYGYISKIKEYDIVSYVEGSMITFNNMGFENTFMPPQLDEYKIGLLKSEEPQITIFTCDQNKIELYKEKIKVRVISELYQRLEKTKKQLDGVLR
jgi:hypothetical protein